MTRDLPRARRAARSLRSVRATPRALDTLPGALAWATVVGSIALAIAAPGAALGAAAALACYAAIRFLAAGAAAWTGARRVRQWEAADWRARGEAVSGPGELVGSAVRHLVIVPNLREDLAVLRRTLDRLARQAGARERMLVVLAMEAAEPGAQAKGAALAREFGGCFARIVVTLHPAGRRGEAACKSANLRWALARARGVALDELGWPRDAVLVTAMDADTLWHPQHVAALSATFAADPARHATFFQAPIRYHANVRCTHPLLRPLHAYASAWELAYLAAPWWRALPMSSYALSLRLLDESDSWDPSATADEWRMYLRAARRRGVEPRLRPIWLPFLASAPPDAGWRDALRARYRQTLRHAWGAQEIGYALAQRPAAASRPSWLGLVLRVAHDNLLASAGWAVLWLGPQLAALLHPAWLRAHLAAPAFLLLQGAFALTALLTLTVWAADVRARPDGPAARRDLLREIAWLPLLGVLTLVCVALPALHAQTRLLLGKPITFRVTPKS